MLSGCQLGGSSNCWAMSTSLKDCQIQCIEGCKVCSIQKVFRKILNGLRYVVDSCMVINL